MTNEEAIEILIAVSVCDRPILSCDFCARYVGTGNGCDEPTDKEIEEAVLLLKGESNDAAISALRQQDVADKDVGKNESLTNAQKIRAMSDEELAEFISSIPMCVGKDEDLNCEIDVCKECFLKWLQMPAEEDKHD